MAKTVHRAKAKAKKLHGASHRHYTFYAGTAIRQGLLLSWHHQPNHCSFYRPLHHHHHHYHHIFNPPYLGGVLKYVQVIQIANHI